MNEKCKQVHPSCKCSKCGKSQEDGVALFDYYHVGEGVFCTECRNQVTDFEKQVKTIKEAPGFNKYGQFYGFD
ncbi:hypothetical protein [Bacteroides sp.]|uniref:hypothetical protein n=1 Tax=Bacteroides sp. TaxID=29523 RepID=UPI003D0F1C5E